METNVQHDKKGKKGKKFEAGTEGARVSSIFGVGDAAAAATTTGEAKEKGAARPRKWDYGITDDAQIVRIADAPSVRKDVELAWAETFDTPTVHDYMKGFSNKSDARHGLRVLARRKLIKIVHKNGDEFPKEYVAPVKPVKAEAPETPAAA
jgi:hypothetical protein